MKSICSNKSNNIKIFITIVAIVAILLSNFLKMHYAQDTYCVIQSGFREYAETFMYSGRPISSISMLIAEFFKISPKMYVCGMSYIAVFALSLSIYILANTLIKLLGCNSDNKKCIFIYMLAFITIFNFCTIDLLVFAESGVLTLGILFSVIAGCLFATNIKHRYIYSLICGLIGVLCHQAVFNIYVPIALIMVVQKNKESIVKTLKSSFGALFIYGIDIIIGTLITKVLNAIINIAARPTKLQTIGTIIKTYKKYLSMLVLKTLDVGPKYWYVVVISIISIIFLIYIFKYKERKIFIFYYVAILASTMLLPILPLVVVEENSQYLELRMSMCFGASIGLMLIYIVLMLDININKILSRLIKIIIVLMLVFNCQYIVQASGEMVATNLLDRNIADSILEKIKEYEIENNTTIKYIGIDYDTSLEFYYHGSSIYRCINLKSLATDWAVVPIINLYGNRNLIRTQIPEDVHKQYFEGKDWHAYNEEQIICIDDTVYICIY